MNIESICAHEYEHDAKPTTPHIQGIFASSSYKLPSFDEGVDIFSGKQAGDVYARYGHPNYRSVLHKLTQLESGTSQKPCKGILTSSGMSAIHTLLSTLCEAGDHIITANDLYGGTTDMINHSLHRAGIHCHSIDLENPSRLETFLKKHSPKAVFLESPSNPLLKCYDISQIAEICRANNAYLIVDNTFATPLLQRPLELGADFVIYSTTKYFNGHGTALGGAVLTNHEEFIEKDHLKTMIYNGATIAPFEAWLLHQGLKTLPLRMRQQVSNADRLATFLSDHPAVKKVHYPGLPSHPTRDIATQQMEGPGAMISFESKGDPGQLLDQLKLITLAPTLGDLNTLVLHPETMSHRNMSPELKQQIGISPHLIRLSVGIENVEDLVEDLGRALGH